VSVRVLQSFPHKIGAGRICTTAWHQAADTSAAGAEVTVAAGVVHRPLPAGVRTWTTLSRGRLRIPYSVVGSDRALALHDQLVARRLPRLESEVDVVHTWPLAALATLREAKRRGITTVLERPNAHTRFAYTTVREESERLGVSLPPDHEHAFNASRLAHEEQEYELADYLLCPSEFVAESFRNQGFPEEKLLRHSYGYDPALFRPAAASPHGSGRSGLAVLFVGLCAVRKGLHFALDAWLRSPASDSGSFVIAGEFLPEYQAALADRLAHPSVSVLGHRSDVPELMRRHSVLVLPSIEEGSPLVCMEAVGSGLVPLVSEACAEVNVNDNALVHPIGDVERLASHFTLLHRDRSELDRLRDSCLEAAPQLTWGHAGEVLRDAYCQARSGRATGLAGAAL
jgi:glycosyltransferase involved in cell wall biosynthesis